MPRKKMARAANGAGSIRKRTQVKNGKSYTYYEARCTVGFDPAPENRFSTSTTNFQRTRSVEDWAFLPNRFGMSTGFCIKRSNRRLTFAVCQVTPPMLIIFQEL